MKPLTIGPIIIEKPIALAPMTGVSDLPFRQLTQKLGAGLVVSEMVASKDLCQAHANANRRASGDGCVPYVIQLVGSEAHWMAEGARIANDKGADIVDINMGCPARLVTGKQSGSALMRDLDHASRLIEAVVHASQKPVTLKMRLGWDDRQRNAPQLAARAEQAGIRCLFVHARTRNQFFKGTADWTYVRRVKAAVKIPVVINGDITDSSSARLALQRSGSDGVMIGRGAYGAPWRPAQIATALITGKDPGAPPPSEQATIAITHYESMLTHYGTTTGLKNARKHLGWYLVTSGLSPDRAKAWRAALCQETNPHIVVRGLKTAYGEASSHAA